MMVTDGNGDLMVHKRRYVWLLGEGYVVLCVAKWTGSYWRLAEDDRNPFSIGSTMLGGHVVNLFPVVMVEEVSLERAN